MKFILDENLPPSFCQILQELKFETVHVYEIGLGNVPDEKIIEYAKRTQTAIITNDLDFSRIMALSGQHYPSVITFRMSALNKEIFKEIVSLNFSDFSTFLQEGCLISIDENGIRVRKLPVFR